LPTTLPDIVDIRGLHAEPRFGRLLDYVAAKREGRRWAARRDIDASEIPKLVANIWIIEIEPRAVDDDRPRLRVRLAGTQVERIYGRSLGGEYLEAMAWGTHSARIFASLNRMADDGSSHFLDASALIQPRLSRRVQRLGIPLSDDQQRVSHLLLLAYYEFAAGQPDHFHEIWLDAEETGRDAPGVLNEDP
jgi:hypothetical protein